MHLRNIFHCITLIIFRIKFYYFTPLELVKSPVGIQKANQHSVKQCLVHL